MIAWSLLIFTFAIALFSLYILRKALVAGSWLRLIAALSLSVFIYLYGTWFYLSVYAKYVFGAAVLTMLMIVLFRKKTQVKTSLAKVILNYFTIVIFGTLSILYFTGTAGKAGSIDIAFPLKKGNYFVMQGGKGLPANLFHSSFRGTFFAMDIVKLNRFGNRAQTVFSSKLEDYKIFGDTVYSPCDGKIVFAVEDNPDNIPPIRKRGHHNINGLLIASDSFYLFMGHFKFNAVFVHENDEVKQGQPLALVGNSGYSLEPHLHIQAHEKTNTGIPWYQGKPMKLKFSGKDYLLFETIRAN